MCGVWCLILLGFLSEINVLVTPGIFPRVTLYCCTVLTTAGKTATATDAAIATLTTVLLNIP